MFGSRGACVPLVGKKFFFQTCCIKREHHTRVHLILIICFNPVPDTLLFDHEVVFRIRQATFTAYNVYLHPWVLRDESLIILLGNSPQNRSLECCVSLKVLLEFWHWEEWNLATTIFQIQRLIFNLKGLKITVNCR